MKTIQSFFALLFISAIASSCSVEPIDPAIDISITGSITGTYYMTAFNSSIPTDLNGDGTNSINQMNETPCFNGSFITLNDDATFTANGKGIEIDFTGSTTTTTCFDDGIISGTWALVGNQLSITYMDQGVQYTDVAILSGNTIVSTVENGEVVGTTSTGEPVYLTSNLQVVYTK